MNDKDVHKERRLQDVPAKYVTDAIERIINK